MADRETEHPRGNTPETSAGPELPLEYFPEHFRRTLPDLYAATAVNGRPLAYEIPGAIGIGFISGMSPESPQIALLQSAARERGLSLQVGHPSDHLVMRLEVPVPRRNLSVEERNTAIREIESFLTQFQSVLAPKPIASMPQRPNLSERDYRNINVSADAGLTEFILNKTPRLAEALRSNPLCGAFEFGGLATIQTVPPSTLLGTDIAELQILARACHLELEHLRGKGGQVLRLSCIPGEGPERKGRIESLIVFAATHLDKLMAQSDG